MLQAAYGVANGVTVTQTGAQGLVREWTDSSTGGAKVTAGFADGVQAAAGASGNKTATWVTSSLWVAQLFALKNEAADGSGTVAASFTTASASRAGLTETLTYTPAAGSMANGDVSFVVPAGWTAPQATTSSAAGYVTATGGSGTNTIAVTGTGPWTVTASGVTLNQGSAQTLVIKYGDTSGGGAGATASATTGGVVWTTKQRSSSRGALTNLAAQPTITVYAADGTGTVASSLSAVSGSQAGLTETLTYTAPAGGLSNGTLTVAVPAGWTPPSTSAGPGLTTSSVGTVSVAGQTITVSGVTRAAGQTVVITYGSGATATAPAGPGAQSWQVTEASTAGGAPTAIAVSPTITIYAPDGSGSATTPTTNVSASQTGNTVVFTYTVASGDMANGGVKLTIPAGWSAPSVSAVAAGYTTSSAGTVAVAGQVVTISAITLAAGTPVTITYGSKAGGGAGATATATTGAQTWQLQQRSTAGGVFTNLGTSPSVTINAANGSGTLTASVANVSAAQTGRTITFTYTAAAGGIASGAVTVTAPAGWSSPSTTPGVAGYTTASTGTVSAAGQTITVSGVTLGGGATMTVVYGDTSGGGPGATASATTGAQTWQGQEKSTAGGVLANLAASPSVTVYAADGSGTATASISVVSAGQSGRTVTLTYTAATGGMLSGSLSVAVPAGWTPPATVAGPGFTTSSVGAVVRVGADDHGHRRDARGRADRRHHVRLRRDGHRARNDRRADLAGAGELDRRRLTHVDRVLSRGDRVCQRRLRDAHAGDRERVGIPDRKHDGVHLHGGRGRPERWHGHDRRPRRLERALDERRRSGLHHLDRRQRGHRGPDDHRVCADARGRCHRDHHLRLEGGRRRGRDGAGRDRSADVADTGALDGSGRVDEPRARRRRSRSTRPTAPAP